MAIDRNKVQKQAETFVASGKMDRAIDEFLKLRSAFKIIRFQDQRGSGRGISKVSGQNCEIRLFQ